MRRHCCLQSDQAPWSVATSDSEIRNSGCKRCLHLRHGPEHGGLGDLESERRRWHQDPAEVCRDSQSGWNDLHRRIFAMPMRWTHTSSVVAEKRRSRPTSPSTVSAMSRSRAIPENLALNSITGDVVSSVSGDPVGQLVNVQRPCEQHVVDRNLGPDAEIL